MTMKEVHPRNESAIKSTLNLKSKLSKLFTLTTLRSILQLQVHYLPSLEKHWIENRELFMVHLWMTAPKPDRSCIASSWVANAWC